ncbi:OmpA family protein [Sphingobacterium alkalisoli]|uniref:OmpA family protein n=1 Tax=Sphingobacterium alkalisoli TaxID=1874115 RepID=A0A4U0H929_9SPHI|nr:OmpA family protein [Sphingobacterium alkalisoli]TJY66982.1 OmpA family protein [Sphingobacterium alkalisoli]
MKQSRMHKITVGLLALGFWTGISQFGYAQEQPSRQQRAAQLYENMEYANAAKAYELVVNKDNPDVEQMERLASSYLYINQYALAENWYARIVEHEKASEQSFWDYAEVLQLQGKYSEAKIAYANYQKKYGDKAEISRAIIGTDSALFWMENPSKHVIMNEQDINTSLSEFGLIPTSGGVLYAAEPNSLLAEKSGMTGQPYLKIYSATRNDDGSLSYPNVMPDSFNESPFHLGPIVTDAKEEVLYVTRTYPGKQVEKYRANGQKWRKQNLELKIYRKQENNWVEEDFAYNNVKEYSVGHAALSTDENTLYFSSDMPGGNGGVDIWFCSKQADGSWGAPVNAGSSINTDGDEVFPSVFDNLLYFSSTGHVGMGGLDIFQARGQRGNFEKPKNLGYPVNSPSDDFSFVVVGDNLDENFGYLSSNRQGGIGADDIYSFRYEKPKITVTLEGMTRDKKTGESLSFTTVSLSDETGKLVSTSSSDDKGAFSFDIDRNTAYLVLADKAGYMADSVSVPGVIPQQDTTIHVVLNLQPVNKVGEKFVLENIYYDFDKHNIRPDAAIILDKLVTTLRNNPTLRIELSSHTDSRGSDSYNKKLSDRRAKSAVDYIVSKGIGADRLVAKGYGETRLVNKCSNGVKCKEAEHQQNRRTEVEVLAF